MADKTTTTFETVGEDVGKHILNCSGQRNNPYTITTARKGGGKSVQASGTKANRGRTQIAEANGPACTIKATLYHANAAEASATLRNTRIMKPAVGDRDFRSRSIYGMVN